MCIKDQLSNLPDDILKKEMLKLILKDVDVSDEKYQESFKETYNKKYSNLIIKLKRKKKK